MALHATLPRIALACIATLCAAHLSAQTPPAINQFLGSLADQPATHTGFVFDRAMMQIARDMLQSSGMTPERASAALSSISFDNYRYAEPVAYAPDTMAAIASSYHSAGWKHLVDAHDKAPTNAGHHGAATDLWLHFNGSDIDGITVLTRGARNMNVIQVAGDLRPLELLRLSGHFGIPKVDSSAVMVPDPKDR